MLSTSLVFLAAGVLLGPGFVGWIDVQADDEIVQSIADVALVTVLFTDGLRLGLRDIARAGRAPLRALGIGMPLTIVGIAVLVGLLTPLSWPAAFLVGAVLSPTDPVFASAIIGRQEVPYRLRRLLSIESGLNDGIALPVRPDPAGHAGEGCAHPLRGARGARAGPAHRAGAAGCSSRCCSASRCPGHAHAAAARPAGGRAAAVRGGRPDPWQRLPGGVPGRCDAGHPRPAAQEAFHQLGEVLSELVKFLALLLFGALLTPLLFTDVGWGAYVVAVLAVLVVRPLSFVVSLLGERIPRRELWTAAPTRRCTAPSRPAAAACAWPVRSRRRRSAGAAPRPGRSAAPPRSTASPGRCRRPGAGAPPAAPRSRRPRPRRTGRWSGRGRRRRR